MIMQPSAHYTERELQELEAKLHAFGTPFQSPEPDDRYWTNFRVRVMDRIDASPVPVKHTIFSMVSDSISAGSSEF